VAEPINPCLLRLRKDGTLRRIKRKWFGAGA